MTNLEKARNALRNLIKESEYSRTGKLPSPEELDKTELWWLTNATELASWDKRELTRLKRDADAYSRIKFQEQPFTTGEMGQ